MPRFLSALGVLLVVGLIAGVAMAFAGSQGDQGGTAYALVNPDGGSPQLVAGHTSGFIAVSHGGGLTGDYCLTPASGVNVSTPAAVADEEAFTRTWPDSSQSVTTHRTRIARRDSSKLRASTTT